MDLAEHLDQPQPVRVDGVDYPFSELAIASLAKLQAWIKEHVPNPLVAIRSQLKGFDAEDRHFLLDQARKDAANWPPLMGSPQAGRLLAERPDFQVETLWVGLQQHWPECERATAEHLHRKVKNLPQARTIYAILFGMPEDAEEGESEGEGDSKKD